MSTDSGLPPDDRCTVDPRRGQFAQLSALPPDEPVTMLNLLRYREVADYSGAEDLTPVEPITGAEAYRIYTEGAMPHLRAAGAQVISHGQCGPTVIGPADEEWDSILIVRYPNPAAFVDMVKAPEYQSLSRHRTAALADARLIATSV
ncbi:DUF1330 domain-containing protein [Gordonia rhizosphera]|uniref:DUF1330 domain-containing protein n=1 Tax=Gordonia rhizosphera NBRC 16068 TaxID=1108045 RepID=K6UZE2_9ACTN|nr:DUF1330 domain-containing protein [Gordonia rhizosphera]GAB88853.1 hypothetical protein GORHZ_046_00020 [Gordonia rhizosphera NBRC 16068]